MTDFALSFQKENKSLFQHEDSLTIKGTWESIQMQEELRKSFWASTRAMKDWLPTSRSLHKPGRHQQLTSAVWSEEQPSSGPAALPRRTLTPARPIGTDREACGAGKWDIRTGSCMRVHSCTGALTGDADNQVAWHIQRSNDRGEGSRAKARAHTGRKRGAGWRVSTAGYGELWMDLLLAAGKRPQREQSPPGCCS